MDQYTKIIISALLILMFTPISASIAQPFHGTHQVIVDASHGGTDPGVKLSDKYFEKDLTLAIASMLKKELDKSGNINVQLTRSADKDLSLSERVKIITASHADIFVGIHVNSGFGKESSGYELYFPGFKSMSAEQINSKEILEDMAKNKYLNDSVKLAQLIQRNLENVFPRKSRGLRNAPLVILEGMKIPGVIVEIGFATNQDDRKKIMDENVRNAVAGALAKSIREYF